MNEEKLERYKIIDVIPEVEDHLSKHWNVENVPISYILDLIYEWIMGYPQDEPIVYVCLVCGEWIE